MSETMRVTRNIKEHIGGSSYDPTVPETNNNSKSMNMYPDEDGLIPKYADPMDCRGGDFSSRLNDLPSGYLSISSFAKSYNTDRDGIFSNSVSENDFWAPPLSFFANSNQKRRKVSFAQEALPTLEVAPPSQDNDDSNCSSDSSKSSLKFSELIPSFANMSLPKLPERSWFCKTCRKPKDECQCMCVIC